MRLRPCTSLLALPVLAAMLLGSFRLHAQTCASQLHEAPPAGANATISVANLRISPKAWQHFEKARKASETGRADVFDRETSLALAAAPRFTQIYILRAAHQVHLSQYDNAVQSIASAREIDPEAPWSSIVLASAWNSSGHYSEAAAALDRVHGAEAVSWQFAFEQARAQVGLHHVVAALQWSETAVNEAPVGCSEAHLLRANAFQVANRPQDAIDQMEAWLAAGPHPEPRRTQVLRVLENTRARIGKEAIMVATK